MCSVGSVVIVDGLSVVSSSTLALVQFDGVSSNSVNGLGSTISSSSAYISFLIVVYFFLSFLCFAVSLSTLALSSMMCSNKSWLSVVV